MADLLRDGAKTIRDVAIADGQNLSDAAVYVNYAVFDTPLEDIYGGNLARLRRIKAKIDPERVMDLAGGFKFQDCPTRLRGIQVNHFNLVS